MMKMWQSRMPYKYGCRMLEETSTTGALFQLTSCWQKCVDHNGDFVEKYQNTSRSCTSNVLQTHTLLSVQPSYLIMKNIFKDQHRSI